MKPWAIIVLALAILAPSTFADERHIIPTAFEGRWDATAAECRDSEHSRGAVIGTSRIRFYEINFRADKIIIRDKENLTLKGSYDEPGDAGRMKLDLRLSGGGQLLTMTGDLKMSLLRCR